MTQVADSSGAPARDTVTFPRDNACVAQRRLRRAVVVCSVLGFILGEALPATAQPATKPPSPADASAPSPPKKADKAAAAADTDEGDDDEGEAPKAGAADADATEDDEDEDEDDFPQAKKKKSVEELDQDLKIVGSGKEPAEPHAGDQAPGSVPESPPLESVKTLEIGPLVGLSLRSGDSDRLSYSPAIAWGGYLRTNLVSFLAARLSYINATHEVDGKPLVDGVETGSYDDVSSFSLRFTLEPTWRSGDLRAFGVLGVGWGKLRVDHVNADDGFHLGASQAGVFIEYPLGIGASYDLLDGWLTLGLLYTFSLHSKVTGDIYQDNRGVTRDGQRVTLGGLPRLDYSQLLALTVAAAF
ncbi:MAG: hypothetical protein R3B07_17135 [Polyangiaceae bacterium]